MQPPRVPVAATPQGTQAARLALVPLLPQHGLGLPWPPIWSEISSGRPASSSPSCNNQTPAQSSALKLHVCPAEPSRRPQSRSVEECSRSPGTHPQVLRDPGCIRARPVSPRTDHRSTSLLTPRAWVVGHTKGDTRSCPPPGGVTSPLPVSSSHRAGPWAARGVGWGGGAGGEPGC